MTSAARRAAGPGAALLWGLLCLRWFDAGRRFRPGWLESVPPAALFLAFLALLALWAAARWPLLRGAPEPSARAGAWLVVGLAILFRLPLATTGSLGYTTADAALSGIVALHLQEGSQHLVFIPHVPYSGSLKSHLTALIGTVLDLPRAFTLASVLFYGFFVLALYRLALLALQAPGRPPPVSGAVAAGVYAAFSPAFVTHYSLSNDGNYVEVLALGTFALLLAARIVREPENRPFLSLLAGLALGLAFWCHILAVIHVAAVGLVLLLVARRRAPGLIARFGLGLALGDLPGLLWNLGHSWDSFRYVLPGAQPVAGLESSGGPAARALALVSDQLPVLLGYDAGYPPGLDLLLRVLAFAALLVLAVALIGALREIRRRRRLDALGVVVLFLLVNLGVAWAALPAIPRNPRYLLFLMAPVPILLARLLGRGSRRLVMAALVLLGAAGSLGQWPSAARADLRWRGFVAALERAGVRHCYTDFYLATPINFVSRERVVCTSKLGPTTTEYFFGYRSAVEAASEAALVAVNSTAADKLERRLSRLGVGWRRLDLMKPVLLPTRKVDPAELFPGHSFPMR